MKTLKIIGIAILVIGVMLALSFGFGIWDAFMTRTVGKEKQDAKREVYESSQSQVEGKRQEAVKYYSEWLDCESIEDKEAIENLVQMSFSNFDESLLNEPQLQQFIINCKY